MRPTELQKGDRLVIPDAKGRERAATFVRRLAIRGMRTSNLVRFDAEQGLVEVSDYTIAHKSRPAEPATAGEG